MQRKPFVYFLPHLCACLLALCATAANAAWKEQLPDTVFPGGYISVYLKLPLDTVTGIRAGTQDTMMLRCGTDSFPLPFITGSGRPWFGRMVPYQAKVGSYDIYTRQGALVERNVTLIPNMAEIAPAIRDVTPTMGVRGAQVFLTVSATGLPFGPLPASGNFRQELRALRLERGSSVIPLTKSNDGNPYWGSFTFKVPLEAEFGAYDLVFERSDGVTTRKVGAYTVIIPPRPEIQKAVPDILYSGSGGTIGVMGINTAYVTVVQNPQGAGFSKVNRDIIQAVILRKDSLIIPAAAYPDIGSHGTLNPSVPATFNPPFDYPLGSYDVGLILRDRQDTAYLPNAVKVLGPGTPALVAVEPNKIGPGGFQAIVKGKFLPAGLVQARITLTGGGDVIAGNNHYGYGDSVITYFSIPPTADYGSYDLKATIGSTTYSLPGAVTIAPPDLGELYFSSLVVGREGYLSYEIRYLNDLQVYGEPDSTGNVSVTHKIDAIRICKDSQCVPGTFDDFVWKGIGIRVSLPPAFKPGLYDFEMTVLDPVRVIRKTNAVPVAPPGYVPMLHWTGSYHYPFLSARADSAIAMDLRGQGCRADSYALAKGQDLPGVSVNGETLNWTPRMADTGWVFIRLDPLFQGECPEGLYLAVNVLPNHATAIKTALRPAQRQKGISILGTVGDAFRIRLEKPSRLEFISLHGRLLGIFANLGPGVHALKFPGRRAEHGLFLCRVVDSDGEVWVRMLR